jgi:hypothetical protein
VAYFQFAVFMHFACFLHQKESLTNHSNMSLKIIILSFLLLLFRTGIAQQDSGEDCQIGIPSIIDPYCGVDTCLVGQHFVVYHWGNCEIEKIHYQVLDQDGLNVIYEGDTYWDGMKSNGISYGPGYFPYRLTFYTKDKKKFTIHGSVYLRH